MTLSREPTETYREDCTPVLVTERLVLRAPRIEDAKSVAALANDRRIAENTLRIPHPYKQSDALDWLSAANTRAGEATFLVWCDDDLVGACGVDLRANDILEIGYWIGTPFWGNGYATEAARAVIDHVFSTSPYDVLHAGARVSNPASRRVLQKCGFQWTSVALYRFPAIKTSAPCDRFRLERGIWQSLKQWGAAPNAIHAVAAE
jgi:RimJ/RimL family protein N-acetyltransferase